MREFIYGQYKYKYEFIAQDRKTLSLTVRPDMGIVLKCPLQADENRIQLFLKKKWKWLNKQLHFFKKFQKKVYQKEYISGEGFMYLGRQYTLIVKRAKEDKVSLTKGRLLLNTQNLVADGSYNKMLIEKWFKQRAELIFQERFQEVLKHFNYSEEIKLSIRKMNKRWGSFFEKSRIILNPQLIHAPKYCIDYVIAHELCHVRYKKHNNNFYKYLAEVIPDWEERKERLEQVVF